MPALKNNRHEQFCQHYVGGLGPQAAFRKIKSGGPAKSDKVNAQKLLDRPDVMARVAELKDADSDKHADLREEVVEFLKTTLRGAPNDASMDNPACELKHVGKEAIPVAVFASKLGAVERLAKLHGWDRDVLRLEASEKVIELVGNEGLFE